MPETRTVLPSLPGRLRLMRHEMRGRIPPRRLSRRQGSHRAALRGGAMAEWRHRRRAVQRHLEVPKYHQRRRPRVSLAAWCAASAGLAAGGFRTRTSSRCCVAALASWHPMGARLPIAVMADARLGAGWRFGRWSSMQWSLGHRRPSAFVGRGARRIDKHRVHMCRSTRPLRCCFGAVRPPDRKARCRPSACHRTAAPASAFWRNCAGVAMGARHHGLRASCAECAE